MRQENSTFEVWLRFDKILQELKMTKPRKHTTVFNLLKNDTLNLLNKVTLPQHPLPMSQTFFSTKFNIIIIFSTSDHGDLFCKQPYIRHQDADV